MSFLGYIKSKEGRKILMQIVGIYLVVLIVSWVFLWWYTDHGQQVSVPDLKGMTTAEAEQVLADMDLTFLVVDSVFVKDAKGGTILEQNPVPESKVKEGRQVFVTVYRIEPPQETINIKEGDFAQVAIIKLKNKGIEFDTKYVPNNSMVGAVISVTYKGKKVRPGDKIPRGNKVVLTVGTAVDQLVRIPNLVGLTYSEAMTRLDTLNLMGQAFFMYDVQSSADSAVGRICEQDPPFDPDAPGVQAGKIVDFKIFNTPCTTEPVEGP